MRSVIRIPRPKPVRIDLGALLLGAARDGVGDRAVGEDAGDQELSSVEQHACTITYSRAVASRRFDAGTANVEPFV